MAGMSRPGKRARRAVALLIVIGVAAWLMAPYSRSALLLLDLTGTADRWRSWLPSDRREVREQNLVIPTRHGPVPARIYFGESESRAVIAVFPGIHAGGVDEPRLAALTRRIAERGATVVSVPLPDLRRYRITPASTDVIEDVATWMTGNRAMAPSGRIGLVGVSFSGGLALVAAGRPSLAGKLTGVFSLGGHADLPRVMQYLCTGRLPDGRIQPPHDYGVVIILRAAIPSLVPPDQAPALDRAVVTFLDASSYDSLDRARSAALFAQARAAAADLPEPSRTLMQWVNDRNVQALGAKLLPYVEMLGGAAALSPARSPATQAPVFLLHGRDDNVIPSEETSALADYLREAGNGRVRPLLTPLLTHADARPPSAPAEFIRLVTFWTAMWRAFD